MVICNLFYNVNVATCTEAATGINQLLESTNRLNQPIALFLRCCFSL